mgnify:FL=1
MTEKKQFRTPLMDLADALCKDKNGKIFKNRVVMYQLLINVAGGNLLDFHDYSLDSIDVLINKIQEYITDMYQTAGSNRKLGKSNEYSSLHKYIYENITTCETKIRFDSRLGNDAMLTQGKLNSTGVTPNTNHGIAPSPSLQSNISNILSNRHGKKIPQRWQDVLIGSHNDYSVFIRRIFWVIEYYVVYYCYNSGNVCTINTDISADRGEYGCREYFQLTTEKKTGLCQALCKYCSPYSNAAKMLSPITINLYSVSRIVLDTIIHHINFCMDLSIGKISDFDEEISKASTTELKQFNEFRKYVDCFGDETLERIHALEKYAPNNCYAADELGNTFFFGKIVYFGRGQYYIERDYKKSVDCYRMAIRNSNPPLQSSCWSLGQALERMKCDPEQEEERRNKIDRKSVV